RIRPGAARDHLDTDARTPDLELLDRGGAEGVARAQHHGETLLLVEAGELADRRGLAGAVHADHEDDEGLPRPVHDERLGDGAQHLRDRTRQALAHLLGARLARETLGRETLGQLGRHGRPEIGGDEELLELLQRRRIELALAEDAGDALAELARAAAEPRLEPAQPAATRCRALLAHRRHCATTPQTTRARSSAPSAAMTDARAMLPGAAAPSSLTAAKCSLLPRPSSSTRTSAVLPTRLARKRASARSPAARKRAARALRSAGGTCGMRAAGVPARAE